MDNRPSGFGTLTGLYRPITAMQYCPSTTTGTALVTVSLRTWRTLNSCAAFSSAGTASSSSVRADVRPAGATDNDTPDGQLHRRDEPGSSSPFPTQRCSDRIVGTLIGCLSLPTNKPGFGQTSTLAFAPGIRQKHHRHHRHWKSLSSACRIRWIADHQQVTNRAYWKRLSHKRIFRPQYAAKSPLTAWKK